ncbi:MAG TPA: AAA family ATPase, partial [Archangium sp.]|nr:AAA family ATPase [Archangium sp.]
GTRSAFEDDLRGLEKNLPERVRVVRAWVEAYLARREGGPGSAAHVSVEAAVVLLTERKLDREVAGALTSTEVTGMLGQHPRIQDRKLPLRLDEFLARLSDFRQVRVPAYHAYRTLLRDLLDRERRRLRLEEFTPKVLTSFVRNKLIDEVYLPLIGANLAKQLGSAGENKRTDRMGMLLLMSPPGYGKTTLMEYVASRLGLTFVKVNGPALGHSVKSLDPAEAPNATARQEVERINLSFEMGNNVMLYLDDIQHTDPELLQKFISLCDGQRRIEGVWNGKTRTYDLRGKKFCVVMAGNPYTETGDRFRIPDMLANRADTYNLGDILDGKEDLFALSYIENALTSNSALAPLATREPGDIHKLIRMAKGEEVPTGELSYGYAAAELQEIIAVFQRLFRVQQVLLKVNLEYIASAAQDERFRTEPAFKLQGSYRNMGKITEKVVAAMTEDELERLIDDHYQGESQTLTTAAEQNLLKLQEMRGRLTPEKAKRWEEIKQGFARVKRMGGKEDDPVARVTGQLSAIEEQLGSVAGAVVKAAEVTRQPSGPSPVAEVLPRLESLREA